MGIPVPWCFFEMRCHADPQPPDRLQPQGTAHSRVISLDAPAREEDTTLGEVLVGERDPHEETASRDATRAEIEELARQMKEFGVDLSNVADNCPKQQRTLDAAGRPWQLR